MHTEIEQLEQIAAPLAVSMGLALWGIEILSGAGRQIVRLYIDSDTGVDVEQCAAFSRSLGVALDVENVIHGPYTLEVSSPGLDRQFFSVSQMTPYVGEMVDARLSEPQDGRKHFRGPLAAVGESNFTLEVDGKPVAIDWSAVKKAHLVYQFPTTGKDDARRA